MAKKINTTKFTHEPTRAEALIKVIRGDRGNYRVETWLPPGMQFHHNFPDNISRCGTIEQARVAWVAQKNYLKGHGFNPCAW